MADYKILSLDGGGSWALIQARALGVLYGDNTSGRALLSKFNLIAANSGGSLVAGGLAVGMTPSEIYNNLFLDELQRRKIFVEKWYSITTRFLGIGPRYKTADKLNGLREVLAQRSHITGVNGDTPLNKLRNGDADFPDFLITSFDYDRQRAVYFRSNGRSKASSDPIPDSQPDDQYNPPTLAEALHASSTAPVNYFDEPACFDTLSYRGKRFWDGGTAGLNNPVLAAVIEAISNGVPQNEIKVLSIGTGSVMLPIEDDSVKPSVEPPLATAQSSSNLLSDIKKLAKTIVDDPPDAATYEVFRILHGANAAEPFQIVRFNPLIQPVHFNGQWMTPLNINEDEFEKLVKMDMDAVVQDEVDLINDFCRLWINDNGTEVRHIPNQPIQPADDLSCKIGNSRFTEAVTAARIIGLVT